MGYFDARRNRTKPQTQMTREKSVSFDLRSFTLGALLKLVGNSGGLTPTVDASDQLVVGG
jgi:hypothetical protein